MRPTMVFTIVVARSGVGSGFWFVVVEGLIKQSTE